MRLTLRTLLAYRDGVLDPKDAAVLESKILDSSTAQSISKRIEQEMQNRRLAPIPVDAREFGFEANMVAEFLDDTIPVETLPDMERKCLENNILLSEIGCCHQILSRALSIPAPVAASLRQRIHDLPNSQARLSLENRGKKRRVDLGTQYHVSDSQISVTLQSSKTVPKASRELRGTGIELNDGLGRQVPEYLIGRDHGWLKNAAIALLLVTAFVIAGTIAIGPLDRVGNLMRKSNLSAVAEGSGKAKSVAPVESTSATAGAVESGVVASAPLAKSTNPVSESDSSTSQPIVSESNAAPPTPAVVASKVPAESSIEKPIKNESASVVSSASPVISQGRMQWLPETKVSADAIVFKLAVSESAPETYWMRMSPGEYVGVGQRIVLPPTQRTEMRVEPGIRLLCAGDNDLELKKQNDAPKIQMRSGRLLVFATPDARDIVVDCNGLELSIRFATSDGSCALDLQNTWVPFNGDLDENSKLGSRSQVSLYGVEGELQFEAKWKGEPVGKGALTVKQFINWVEGAATSTQELAEIPWWFRTSVSRPIDQLAAADVQRALSGRDPGQLEAELLELTNHRRGETAALATRTRLMLGMYDGLFESDGILNRKGLHSHWQSILGQIPLSFGRPEHRVKLIQTIQIAAPNRLPAILSLLVPPTQEQLSSGADKILVEGLASPHMDERVLAFNQLNMITGKSLGYQPDKSQLEAITLWRKLLGKNEIRYSETTTP